MSTEQIPDEGSERGFSVSDRRGATTFSDPEPAGDATSDAEKAGDPEAGTAAAAAAAAAAAETRDRARGAASLPGIDFSTLLLSLSTSVYVHLGQAPSPDGQTTQNLPLAKQTIDIIEMLQKKTQGNLLDEETELLTQLLYDLRLRYVAAIK